jgi:predicted HTH domain antitoxin
MFALTLQLPDNIFSTTRLAPQEFAHDICLAAAIHWYETGKISQEKAAELAGLSRTDFLLALAAEKRNVFHVDLDELKQELANVPTKGSH